MTSRFASLLCGLLFCTFTNNLHAQTNLDLKHELYAGYGQGSVPQFGISFGFIIGNALGNAIANGIITRLGGTGVTYTEKITGTGSISMGYNYYPARRWSIGLQGVFERVNDRLEFSNGNAGISRVDVISGMVRTDFRWINKPGFKFYSGAAIGGAAYHYYDVDDSSNSDRDFGVAFAVTPLGLRFGKNIGIFLEGGIGWDGLIKAGISGRF
jgi:hypothetical protein